MVESLRKKIKVTKFKENNLGRPKKTQTPTHICKWLYGYDSSTTENPVFFFFIRHTQIDI